MTHTAARTIIVGKGAWGSALHRVIISTSHEVALWDRRSTLSTASVIILAVPTVAIRDVLTHSPIGEGCIIVNTSKGIEQETALLPHEIVHSILPRSPYFTLIGPSFAREVEKHTPTLVNLATHATSSVSMIKSMFHTSDFHVRLTRDVEVLELFAAFKNVYAIATGFAHGLGLRANTQAMLLTVALDELHHLLRRRRLRISTASSPGTLGDLVLTTYSKESRNYRFGKYLVHKRAEDALREVGSTVEGYSTSFSIRDLVRRHDIQLPFASLVHDMIVCANPHISQQLFHNFISKL